MNTMTCKGFTARIEFDERGAIFVGRLLGVSDMVSFHGEAVNELRGAFEEAVDDYIETCRKIGKKPEKPVSGNMMLRVPPEVHLGALTVAEAHGQSLNQWAAEVLREAAHV